MVSPDTSRGAAAVVKGGAREDFVDNGPPPGSMATVMGQLDHLFAQNRAWAESIRARDPEFFPRLSRQQSPEYLWIGCSDSRVPANEIVNLLPGELFVHRNIANVVVHTDLNCLSVMQFAVDVLKVRHVIVCGHYGCSGVQAALRCDRIGLADNWLRHVQDVAEKHAACVHAVKGEPERTNVLCELNVIEQVGNVCQTTIVRDAWERGQALTVHGWIYGLKDGLIRSLGLCVSSAGELRAQHEAALAAVSR
jgi:carbonic anhydrase